MNKKLKSTMNSVLHFLFLFRRRLHSLLDSIEFGKCSSIRISNILMCWNSVFKIWKENLICGYSFVAIASNTKQGKDQISIICFFYNIL